MIASRIAEVNTFRYGVKMDNRKNRQSWLDAGLQTLSHEGHASLRIMPIAQKLKVTKGSFYWHFQNLEEYKSALLEEWELCHTRQAIECVDNLGGDARTKLRYWLMGSVAADFKLARAIRSWSLTNQDAHKMQAQVDLERINYLIKLLRGTGRSKDDATTLGRWAYWAWIGYSTLDSPEISAKQIDLIIDVLTQK